MAKLHSLLHQEWATQRSGHMQYNYNYKLNNNMVEGVGCPVLAAGGG